MTDWFDEIDLDGSEIIPSTRKEKKVNLAKFKGQSDEIEEMEMQILREAVATLEKVPGAIDLDPEHPEIMPDGWVEQYGKKEATRRHRIAQAALLSRGEAPMYLHTQKDLAMALMRGRAEKADHPSLNVVAVQIPVHVSMDVYKRMEVDE